MKPTPKSPEFERFTSALRQILSVFKSEVSSHERKQDLSVPLQPTFPAKGTR